MSKKRKKAVSVATTAFGADEPGTVTIPVTEIRPYPTIKLGSRGPTVAKWQRMLGIEADGNFGRQTDAETKKFQSSHGLTPDGVVGIQTWGEALKNTTPAGMLALEWNQPSPELKSAPAPDAVIPPTPGAMPITGAPATFTVPQTAPPSFATPKGAATVLAPLPKVQEAGIFGSLSNLSTPVKVGIGLAVAAAVVASAPKKPKGHK